MINQNNINECDALLCPCQAVVGENIKRDGITEYIQCCQPYHKYEKLPETAEQLMRSRYSAFVLHKIDYIIETTLPIQQHLLDKQSISDWSEQTDWAGLQIVKHISKVGKRHAQVEFKAWINTDGGKQCHHELSAFVRVVANKQHMQKNAREDKKIGSDTWYFIDPTVHINVPQKQPCICGSGEKFKRCCGLFL